MKNSLKIFLTAIVAINLAVAGLMPAYGCEMAAAAKTKSCCCQDAASSLSPEDSRGGCRAGLSKSDSPCPCDIKPADAADRADAAVNGTTGLTLVLFQPPAPSCWTDAFVSGGICKSPSGASPPLFTKPIYKLTSAYLC